MSQSADIRVSVDVGCHRHSVAIGLAGGDLLEEFELEHRPEGLELFFRRIDSHRRRHGGEVSVAMEGYNGWARPLDTLVRLHGYRLFNINNLKLARFKEIFPGAAKSDRIDARKGLELFQLCDHLPLARGVLQEVAATPRQNDVLRRLTRRRRALGDEKRRLLSRLQGDLQAVCPGLLAMTRDADNVWLLNLLSHSQDLTKLARLHQKTVLAISAVGRKYAAVIRAWQRNGSFSHEVEYVGPMIIEDAPRVLELRSAIKVLAARCDELAKDSRIAQLIDTIPGFATVCSSGLAGEIGTIERFASEASLALYIGMANLDNSSGSMHGAKRPRQVNSRAKAAMMVGADRHRKLNAQSQRYHEKKRSEGKTHNQAIRALGRHLSRVIFRMIKQDRAYEVR